MKVEVSNVTNWISNKQISLLDDDLRRIIEFYVINTPVTKLSARAISLNEYGWNSPWNKKYYLNKQLKALSTSASLLFSAQRYNEMDVTLNKADLLDPFPDNITYERIAIYNNMKNQFISTFYHMRNSFAHGRFDVRTIEGENDDVIIMEDGALNKKSGNFKISARMVLRKSTLIKWIELIEGGETEYQKEEQEASEELIDDK